MTKHARVLATDKDGCPGSYLLFDFAPGSEKLHADHRDFLDEPIVRILETETATVRLVGRTAESEPRAKGLAARRVKTVTEYLRSQGVSAERVQGDVADGAPPGISNASAAERRSIEIVPAIAKEFRLILLDIGIVEEATHAVKVIDDAMKSIVRRAGRELKSVRTAVQQAGDVTIRFLRGGHEQRPCGVLFLGEEGGGQVFIGAHEDLRVCSSPERTPQGDIDYVSTIERVFDPKEKLFAQVVAHTALHELGHILAKLEHTDDRTNYMFTTAESGSGLPKWERTRERLRRHYGDPQSFSEDQIKRMVCALRSGHYAGGMRVKSAARAKPPVSKKPRLKVK